MTMRHCKTQIPWSWLELLNSFFVLNEGCFTLFLFTTGLCRCHSSLKDQYIGDLMLWYLHRFFCRIHWIWAPLKVDVSRNKCSHKRGIMYFEMPALRRGKISACNMPFNCTSNVGSGLYGLNPCTNKIISCTYNVIYANWRKLAILNFINLMPVSFWEYVYLHNKKIMSISSPCPASMLMLCFRGKFRRKASRRRVRIRKRTGGEEEKGR